jgi:hypothetical protein
VRRDARDGGEDALDGIANVDADGDAELVGYGADACLEARVRGAYFKTLNTLLALAAGEPGRLFNALALEAAFQSRGGSRARPFVQRLLRAAEPLAGRVKEAEAQAWLC